jgi:hypothetical protein
MATVCLVNQTLNNKAYYLYLRVRSFFYKYHPKIKICTIIIVSGIRQKKIIRG